MGTSLMCLVVLLITVSFLWLQALQNTELKICRKLAWGCRSHPRTLNQGDGDTDDRVWGPTLVPG